jgi:transcription elongation factor GreA
MQTGHKPIIFTEEGFGKILKQKLELEKKRTEVLVRLAYARSQGDLSENGAYHSAKAELTSVDRQLRQIKIFERFGKIISGNDKNTVDIGSTVVVKDGEIITEYKIVGDFESDPVNKKISANSPIGAALMGKKVGEECEVILPEKKIILKIVEIK